MLYRVSSRSFPNRTAVERSGRGWLAIVRHNGLEVKELELAAGRTVYLATTRPPPPRDPKHGSETRLQFVSLR